MKTRFRPSLAAWIGVSGIGHCCWQLNLGGGAGSIWRRTRALIELADWLVAAGCRHVAMETTGIY